MPPRCTLVDMKLGVLSRRPYIQQVILCKGPECDMSRAVDPQALIFAHPVTAKTTVEEITHTIGFIYFGHWIGIAFSQDDPDYTQLPNIGMLLTSPEAGPAGVVGKAVELCSADDYPVVPIPNHSNGKCEIDLLIAMFGSRIKVNLPACSAQAIIGEPILSPLAPATPSPVGSIYDSVTSLSSFSATGTPLGTPRQVDPDTSVKSDVFGKIGKAVKKALSARRSKRVVPNRSLENYGLSHSATFTIPCEQDTAAELGNWRDETPEPEQCGYSLGADLGAVSMVYAGERVIALRANLESLNTDIVYVDLDAAAEMEEEVEQVPYMTLINPSPMSQSIAENVAGVSAPVSESVSAPVVAAEASRVAAPGATGATLAPVAGPSNVASGSNAAAIIRRPSPSPFARPPNDDGRFSASIAIAVPSHVSGIVSAPNPTAESSADATPPHACLTSDVAPASNTHPDSLSPLNLAPAVPQGVTPSTPLSAAASVSAPGAPETAPTAPTAGPSNITPSTDVNEEIRHPDSVYARAPRDAGKWYAAFGDEPEPPSTPKGKNKGKGKPTYPPQTPRFPQTPGQQIVAKKEDEKVKCCCVVM